MTLNDFEEDLLYFLFIWGRNQLGDFKRKTLQGRAQ